MFIQARSGCSYSDLIRGQELPEGACGYEKDLMKKILHTHRVFMCTQSMKPGSLSFFRHWDTPFQIVTLTSADTLYTFVEKNPLRTASQVCIVVMFQNPCQWDPNRNRGTETL